MLTSAQEIFDLSLTLRLSLSVILSFVEGLAFRLLLCVGSMKDIFKILPKDHFGKTMDRTIQALVGGESVCVYCMPGGGIHYFLQIAQRILQEDYPDIKTFFFDGFLYPSGLNQVIRQTIFQKLHLKVQVDFYQQLQNYFEAKRIVILLAHVNEVLQKQPKTLEYLLKLIHLYPSRLAVLSNCDQSVVCDFDKFFSASKTIFSNLAKIPPFDQEGTRRILEANQQALGYNYPLATVKKIHQLSGGNPSLIKHLGKCVDEMGQQVLSDPKMLINYPSLKIKLNDINEVILSESKEVLEQIGIINQKGKLFSPLVAEYYKNYELENIEEIVPSLTPQEKRILTFFLKNKGKIIDKDHIFMLMELAEEDYSLWAIYKAISRLKNKIKGKYQLRALKSRGYLLASQGNALRS